MNQRNYEFALIIDGVSDLTPKIGDALFEAGCDDATFSFQHGCVYADFSREAPSLQEAILSAIADIRKANIGAVVLRVDEADLVTQADIARRIGRTRQLVCQYISGQRGPGGFPPPECHFKDDSPMWSWCAVSDWLARNHLIRDEERYNAEVVAAINNWLDGVRQKKRNPKLIQAISRSVGIA